MSFYWSWTDSLETTFGLSHEVYDENVFGFTIEHREGECATLTLTIRNPRVGLLSAGRQVWGWLSWNDGTATTPLFFGRLVGIPNMQGSASGFAETMDLVFVAKPIDFAAQRRDLANSLAVLPYYDPIFISEDLRLNAGAGTGDINTALEARSARWHCSRGEDGLPLVVTISDINVGEDGTEIFESSTASPACIDPASVSLSISGTPLVSVTVKASVPWKQDMPDGPAIDLGSFEIDSWGSSLVNSWPKPGASLGGGWAAAQGTFAFDKFKIDAITTSDFHLNWQNRAKEHREGDSMSLSISKTDVVIQGPYINQILTRNLQAGVVWVPGNWTNAFASNTLPQSDTTSWGQFAFDDDIQQEDGESDVINIPLHHDASWAVVAKATTVASLAITFDAGADRQENCNFTMIADVQPVLTDPDDFDTAGDATPPDETILELSGADPTACIDGVAAINPSMSSYFHTERGKQSVEYLLLRARALLMAGARIVEVSFGIPFERALDLTCRKNVRLNWEKLPGGYAGGKVIQYSISANEGKLQGSVTIGCTVGRNEIGTGGSSYVAVGGAGELVIPAEDALEPGIQQMIGQVIPAGDLADVAFQPALQSIDSAGNVVPVTRDDVLLGVNISGSAAAQEAAIRFALGEAQAQAAAQEAIPVFALPVGAPAQATAKENASTLATQLVNQAMQNNEIAIEFELLSTNNLKFADVNLPTLEPLLVPRTIDLEDPVTT